MAVEGPTTVNEPDVTAREDDRTAETGAGATSAFSDWDVSARRRTRQPGEHLDRYIILERLGAGGMGVVYAAYDPKLDRKVALKVLLGGGSSRAEFEARERLVAEARALARVSHPNVVAVHDVGQADDEVYVGMELVEGRTLKGWLEEKKRSWQEIIDVFLEVSQGIGAVHEAGFIHRDVKPENVLLDRRDRVRVTDFGLARPRGDAPAVLDITEKEVVEGAEAGPRVDLTQSGAYLGTPAYMAPEQFEHGDATEKSDQFGFSVACWEALYGERPFAGRKMLILMKNVMEGKLREPPSGSGVPDWIRRILERGLAVDPAQRWPSMAAMREALEAGDPRARTRRLAATLIGVAAVLGLAGGAYAQQRAEEQRAIAACDAAGAALEWGPDRAEAMRAAFIESGAATAEVTAGKAIDRLDEWAEKWREARSEACLRGEVRRELEPDLARLSIECLDEQRAQFEGTVDTLMEGDQVLVDRSLRTVSGLPDVKPCGDVAHLQRLPPRPEDPEARARVHEINKVLDRTLVNEHVGTYKEGLEIARAQLVEAETTGYGPTIAKAQYRVAVFLEKLGEYEEAVDYWSRAFREAAVSGDDSMAGDAARVLSFTEGYQLARYDVGLRWAELAEVYHRRADNLESLQEAQRLDVMAIMLEMKGELDESIATHERSIALRRKVAGDKDKSVGYGLHNMAPVLSMAGRQEEALAAREEALEIFEAHFGVDNPTTMSVKFGLANQQRDMGLYDEAEASFEAIEAVWLESLGPNHPDVGDLHDAMGRVRKHQGRFEESVALHRKALAIHVEALGDEHPDVANTDIHLAQALVAGGQREAAETVYVEALAVLAAKPEAQHHRRGVARKGLAHLLLLRGANTEAIELLELAREDFVKDGGENADQIAEVQANLARARAAEGGTERTAALDELEKLVADVELPDAVRARAEINLATLVSSDDRKRALSLAGSARGRVADDPARADMVAEIDALVSGLE